MSNRGKILVVDDSPVMGRMLVESLAQAGWGATAATSVDSALALLGREPFCAVVSDIRMDGRDGYDLLHSIGEGAERVPVILMSSFGTGDTSVRARAEGAFGYLPKPFPLRDLLQLLDKLEP